MAIALTPWNEKSDRIVTVSFLDENGAPITPSAATYRIDCVRPATPILASTVITGLATAVDLVVTAAQNAIVGGASSESHRMTVGFDYGSPSKHQNVEYVWTILNLGGVS